MGTQQNAQANFIPRQNTIARQAALTAGSDLAATGVWRAPCKMKLHSIYILPQGSSAGIDDSNTSVWLLKIGSTTIASLTFNTTVAFPAVSVAQALTLTTTLADLEIAEGAIFTLTITNGATAATPATTVYAKWSTDGEVVV